MHFAPWALEGCHPRNNQETRVFACGIGPKQRPVTNGLMDSAPATGSTRVAPETTEYGSTAMHGKSSKYASTVLSALLYAQGLFGLAGVTLVVVKDRIQVDSVIAMNAASQDAEVR